MLKYLPKKNTYLFLPALSFLLIYACANVVTPTGGDKDISPPEIISELPSNNSTYFKSKEIRVNFNEYILLRDPLRQIIISPPLHPAPEYDIKKRTLVITLPDTLLPNTTYTINFGNSIVDNTEGNPLGAYLYVFSTGSFIDSLFISGRITNAFTNEPVKDVTVMLYGEMNDSLPYNSRPLYFTQTSENGFYRISNVRAGNYKIFALKDENVNYIFDNPSELIGFRNKSVNAVDTNTVNLKIFLNETEQQKLLKTFAEYPGRVVMVFNRPYGEVKFAALEGNQLPEIKHQEFSVDRDTLFIWTADTTLDSLNLIVFENDVKLDTVLVPIRRNRTSTTNLSLSLGMGRTGAMPPGDSIVINFNNPLITVDTSKILILKDSLQEEIIKLNFSDTLTRKLTIKFSSEENTSYHLIALPGAFTDIYSNKNDTIIQKVNVRPLRDFGSFALTVDPKDTGNYLIQLLDVRGNTIREEKFIKQQLNFELLNPGEYIVKVIIDKNNNGHWDTGNYLKKIQPEPVLYFDEPITIRANWFIEQTWNLPAIQSD